MHYIKNLRLPLLQLHLEKELVALQVIETASAINDNLLKQWFIDILNSHSSERDFLLQLNQDHKTDLAYHAFLQFVNIFRKLSRHQLTTSLESYVLMHDLLKPLSSIYHDKLISDILKDYDDRYNLWGNFGVIEPHIKNFYNLSLRYHHILGVMIIGEMNYLIFEELFDDADFQKIDLNAKKLLLEFLILHAAIDSAAIYDGYLSRKKAERYFTVMTRVEQICDASNRDELLHQMSIETSMERIEWLVSSYDPLIDTRPPNFYRNIFTREQFNRLQENDFIQGFAKIRRISYGAKFLYCMLHQIDHLEVPHDLAQPAVGEQSFLNFMKAMSEIAHSVEYPIEVHFKNTPETPEDRYRAFVLLENADSSFELFNHSSKLARNGTVYIEVDLRLLF